MEFYKVIETRVTTRDFTGEPVDMDTVRRILKAGLKAPTHDHLRDWEFIVVTDDNTLEQLLTKVPGFTGDYPDTQNRSPAQAMYAAAMPRQYNMLRQAGCLVLPFFKQNTSLYKPETISTLNAFASIWCCIENIFLATAAEGLACSMRIPTGSEPEHIKKVLAHPDNYIMPCYIGIGHPAADAILPVQIEYNINNKIHNNRW